MISFVERYEKKTDTLIVDTTTEIPLLEMKINMQATPDTLPPMSRRQMEIFVMDDIFTLPGRKLGSKKLTKVNRT